MRPALTIACLALAWAQSHAQTPPDRSAVRVSGYKVTAEGGEEGPVTYRYDDQGRPIDGTPRRPDASRPEPATERTGGQPRPTDTATVPSLPPKLGAMRTSDGRALPFQLSSQGGVKTVDENVDADSALRKLSKTSDLLERRFETGQVDLGRDERFSTSGNTVFLDRWQGRSSSPLGARRADIELTDALGAEVRPKNVVELKAVERQTSPWARRIARPAGWDDRLGGAAELGERRVERDEISTMGTRANAFPRNPGSIEQLSMQDINRYQFRRARSTDPGLPVAKPGSETIETR